MITLAKKRGRVSELLADLKPRILEQFPGTKIILNDLKNDFGLMLGEVQILFQVGQKPVWGKSADPADPPETESPPAGRSQGTVRTLSG